MYHLVIKIPEKKDVKRWYDILRFKLTGGFSCTKCGAKDDFNHVRFNSKVNGKRLILENNTRGICAECTRKELNDKAGIVFTENNCKCDWCNEHKTTMSFPRNEDLESNIHFGSQWWNGHHICQACLNIGFGNRSPNESDNITTRNGRLCYQNELGLWIESK